MRPTDSSSLRWWERVGAVMGKVVRRSEQAVQELPATFWRISKRRGSERHRAMALICFVVSSGCGPNWGAETMSLSYRGHGGFKECVVA